MTNRQKINNMKNAGLDWFIDSEMPDHDHKDGCSCQEMYKVISGFYDRRKDNYGL